MEAPFRSLVIGVFNTTDEAEHCVDDLGRAGFAADEIGIIEPDAEAATRSPADETTAERLGSGCTRCHLPACAGASVEARSRPFGRPASTRLRGAVRLAA
jgi:hypothetical protein